MKPRERVEILRIGRVHDIERANRRSRIAKRPLEQRSEPLRDGDLVLPLGDGKLALERLGCGLVTTATLLEVRDGSQGRTIAGRHLFEDRLVTFDRSVDVREPFRVDGCLAHGHGELRRRVRRHASETPEQIGAFAKITSFRGVFDEQAECARVVAVGQDEQQALSRTLSVPELALDCGGLPSSFRALCSLRKVRCAREVHADEIRDAPSTSKMLLERRRDVVVHRVRSRSLFELRERAVVIAELREEHRKFGEQPRTRLAIRERCALLEGVRSLGNSVGLLERLLGEDPKFRSGKGFGGCDIGLASSPHVIVLGAKLAELLHEGTASRLVGDARCMLGDHADREIGPFASLEQLDGSFDRAFVAGRKYRDPGPRLASGRQVFALRLVQLGEPFLERDLLLDVRRVHRLLLDERGEVVPA